MAAAEAFLIRNGFDVEGLDREALLGAFAEEMDAGLAGRPSSLIMIPSFIPVGRPVRTDTRVAVLDAGGTNLRSAVVRIAPDGKAAIESLHRGAMPGTRGRVGADAFYDAFADILMPVLGASDTVGFCFSYAAEVTPECDARLLHWSKQIDAPEIVGTMVGAGLRACLARRGQDRRIVILNDTVATLLAGRAAGVARDYSAYVGFILGTGTNTAYVERNARIAKRPGLDPAGSMPVNVESGAFKKIRQSRFDELLDRGTHDCGAYTFEKMISGGYLGRLGLTVLREAARAGLFSPAAAARIAARESLGNKELDDFCGGAPDGDNPFLDPVFTEADRQTAAALCTPVYERSAVLTAVNIASAVIQTGEGKDPARPVCVNVDGSTFYRTKTARFQDRVKEELRALLEPRGLSYELIRADDSPVIGAAVAGLTV